MIPRRPRAVLPTRRRGLWRAGPVAVLLLLVLPAVALAWDAKVFSSADESRLVSLVNQRRAAAGLSALSVDATLKSVARSRSKRMGDSHTFSHSIGGMSAFDELRAVRYCFLDGAENIAWNTYPDDQATPVAWQALVASPPHLANLLGRAHTRIGVGAYKAADGIHAYVLLFARACDTTAPKPPTTAKPAGRTATSTRAPTAAPSPPATEVPELILADGVHVQGEPPGPPDAERPPPASSREVLVLEEILDLLLPLVRALAGAGA